MQRPLTLRRQLATPPNLISVGRVALLAVAAVLWSQGWQAVGLAVGVVGGIGDYLDGILARRMGLVTPLGAALDQWSDNVCEASTLAFGVHLGIFPFWALVLYLFREFGVICLRTVARHRNLSIGSGIWGKVKTNFLHYAILCGFLSATGFVPLPLASLFAMMGWMGVVGGLFWSYLSGWGYLRQLALRYDGAAP